MNLKENNPTSSELIKCLNTRGHSAAVIHRKLLETYGCIIKVKGKWGNDAFSLSEDHSNVHNNERSGWLSIQTDILSEHVKSEGKSSLYD